MKGSQSATLFLLLLAVTAVVGPPVDPKKPHDKGDVETNEVPDAGQEELNLEYNRYLKEVVQVLESDPEFRKKLEGTNAEDIRSGKIAKELEYVNHNVRSKLDELKRQELERLRHLAIQEYERSRGLGIPHPRPKAPSHLDHNNFETFEIEDLRKLIVQTTKDLEEADKKRKEEFKQYEMQKEFEHREKLKQLDEQARKDEEKKWEDAEKKHKEHPKVHHPGSKQQLEEVWEEQDHMDPESFNPKTFFRLHDLDGNGYWDPDEVKTLFSKELDKVYDPNAPEDDMAERYEEMERMREHVFNETDLNQDYLISYNEFLEQTRKSDFDRDPGWQTLDEQPMYSEQEFLEFERRRQEEIQRLVQQGLLPPQPHMMQPGMYGGAQPIPLVPPYQGQPLPGQQPNRQITPEEAAHYQQQIPLQYQQQLHQQQFASQQAVPQYVPQQQQFAGQQAVPQYVPQQQQFAAQQAAPQYVPQQQYGQYQAQQQQHVPQQQQINKQAAPPQQIQQQQAPGYQQQQVSQTQQQVPQAQQQAPVAQQQIPQAQQQAPVVQQQIPQAQQQIPVAQPQVPQAQLHVVQNQQPQQPVQPVQGQQQVPSQGQQKQPVPPQH